MNQIKTVHLSEIESLLVKALTKIQKKTNPSEQNSGLGLINKASKLAKAYSAQTAETKAQERFERMQLHKLKRLQVTQAEA